MSCCTCTEKYGARALERDARTRYTCAVWLNVSGHLRDRDTSHLYQTHILYNVVVSRKVSHLRAFWSFWSSWSFLMFLEISGNFWKFLHFESCSGSYFWVELFAISVHSVTCLSFLFLGTTISFGFTNIETYIRHTYQLAWFQAMNSKNWSFLYDVMKAWCIIFDDIYLLLFCLDLAG